MPIDYISQLPDRILQHILSFLETPEAARSSTLSRRWRDVWVYVPSLDFNSCGREPCSVYSAMLRFKSSSLRRFRLFVPYSYRDVSTNVNQWIAFSMRYDVEELYLSFRSNPELPKTVLSSRWSLRVLELSSCQFSSIGIVNLARLETLSLQSVEAEDDIFDRLISSSPVLKNLELEYCESITRLNVSLVELRRVVIKECSNLTNVTVDAPKLSFAEYVGDERDAKICFRNSVDLMHAKLKIGKRKVEHGIRGLINLAREFGRARVLNIKCYSYFLIKNSKLKILLGRSALCYNVKQLKLKLQAATSAIAFLKLFPNLEDFTFESFDTRCYYSSDSDYSFYSYSSYESYDSDVSYGSGSAMRQLFDSKIEAEIEAAAEGPKATSIDCLEHSLKRITINNFQANGGEVRLANLLAKHAMVLENMCINCSWGFFKHHLKIRNNLIKRRGCKRARIIYK